MSGGAFDYKQYQMNEIADEILENIQDNKKGWDDFSNEDKIVMPEGWQRYNDKTIKEFQEGYILCKKAAVYAQRIDWLFSGDDGEDTFHNRLKEDLELLQTEIMELGAANWNIGKTVEK